LTDIETKKVFYDKLTFIYLEMPKYNKTIDQLETRFDKWLYVTIGFNGAHGRIDSDHGILINYSTGQNVVVGGGGPNPNDPTLPSTGTFTTRHSAYLAVIDGFVGIGTTSPGKKLTIEGGSIRPAVGNSVDAGIYFPENPGGGGGDEAYIRYFAESGENTKLQIGNDNDADDDISFYQLGAERLTIYNGNVGIGTTAPDGKLEIASGNTKVKFGGSGNDGIHHLSCNRDFVFNTVVDASLNNPAFSFRTLSDFNDMSSYTPLMTITSMGNVGIGTITIPPGYKLAVDGKIICEKIKVIADVPSADYVFDKNYKLLPLNKLENYINTCKHLPDVPSAEEMKKSGIDLAEMNILLLKKIEELTLYLIKQDKRINELENECFNK